MVYNYIADWQAFVAEVAANFAYVRLFRSKYVRIRADDTSSRFPSSVNYSFRPVRTCTRYFHWKKQNLFPSLFDLSSTHSSGAKVNGEEKKIKKKREKKEGRGISFFCEHVLEQRNQYSSVSCLPSSSIDRDENRT